MTIQDKISKLKPVAFVLVFAIIARVIFHNVWVKWITLIIVCLCIFGSVMYVMRGINVFKSKPIDTTVYEQQIHPEAFQNSIKNKRLELELERLNTFIKHEKVKQEVMNKTISDNSSNVKFGAGLGKFLIGGEKK